MQWEVVTLHPAMRALTFSFIDLNPRSINANEVGALFSISSRRQMLFREKNCSRKRKFISVYRCHKLLREILSDSQKRQKSPSNHWPKYIRPLGEWKCKRYGIQSLNIFSNVTLIFASWRQHFYLTKNTKFLKKKSLKEFLKKDSPFEPHRWKQVCLLGFVVIKPIFCGYH